MAAKTKQTQKSSKRIARTVASILAGTFLTRENVARQLPFLIFVVALALIYIGNSYGAERIIIKSERIKQENKVLRYEHILMKSRLMEYDRPSEIARKLEGTGIKESVVPPYKILRNEKY